MAIGTATGLVRKDNQDRAVVVRATFTRSPERNFAVAALCDGIGGMSRGGDAAALALSTFAASLVRSKHLFGDARLSSSVEAADAAVFQEMLGNGGATLSAVLLDERGGLTAVNVGDSRIYEVKRGHKLVQLTTDDTLAAQIQRANINPNDNTVTDRPELRQLVQYVGMGKGIQPHILRLSPRNELEYVVITSDGAHSAHRETLNEALGAAGSSEEIVDRLLILAQWLGGKDNATVVAIKVEHKDTSLTELIPGGPVVEVWSPFGKVEFWGPTIWQGPEDRPPSPAVADGSAVTASSQAPRKVQYSKKNKQRRTDVREKSVKRGPKTGDHGQKKAGGRTQKTEKPQLDITFSPSGRSSDDPQDT